MINFPELPSYRAKAAQIYWEPVMGSGERITAAVITMDATGKADVHCLLPADILGLLFRTQAATASSQLDWVAQSLKQYALKHGSVSGWSSPLVGFESTDFREFAGVNRLDVVDQVASLYSSLYKTAPPIAPSRMLSLTSGKLVAQVRTAARKRYGLDADRVFVETGWIQIPDESGLIKRIEIPVQSASKVGSIVSAFGGAQTLEKNLYRAQSNLAVARGGRQFGAGLFIGRSFASTDMDAARQIDNLIDDFHWRLNRIGYHIEVSETPELIADQIMSWAC